jgi:UDP-N-acetylglucosamine--N-acetylmuramyl-(pentapeptide) pyrophosphoryl-undecaprenol N-acetylglucosamine transferase
VSGCFVVTAGGTGGHLFPAEALARELLNLGRSVHLVTDKRTNVFGERGIEAKVHHVRAARPTGSPAQAARGLAELAAGIVQAHRLLLRLKPAAVVGFGGYPSMPTMAAAVYLRLPTLIHEQNAVLGRANRLLAPMARQIATGFVTATGLRSADRARAVHTGNPVRAAFLEAGRKDYFPPPDGGAIELLVLGGSQGAHILSEIVPPALMMLPAGLRKRLRISQQARPEDVATVSEIYRDGGIAAELNSFFDDVPERLARAHLAICRAGASTVAELAAVGRPALVIPYPFATDDHQTANARAFSNAGGGWMIPQSGLTATTLAARLEDLLADNAVLANTARHAWEFGRRDAARQLAQLALSLERGRTGRLELCGSVA